MKIKDIKSKVAAKVAKGKAKIAAKCGKGKKAAKVAAAVLMAALCAAYLAGCQAPTVPSRSQTQTFDHCTFAFYGSGEGGKTNEVARVDIGSQAMSIENSGSETQTVTPTQTIDTDAALDVPVTKTSTKTLADAVKSAASCADGLCEDSE